jgi:hypothetical protein
MSLGAGFSIAAVVGVSLLMATAAAPQTLGEGSSVAVTPPAVAASPEAVPPVVSPAVLTPEKSASAGDAVPSADASRAADAVPAVQPDAPLDVRVTAEGQNVASLDAELECMAKVVHHEAANQSLQGQLAVAQLILNRVKSPLFPKTICAVVNQPGQFFSTRAYAAPVRSRSRASRVRRTRPRSCPGRCSTTPPSSPRRGRDGGSRSRASAKTSSTDNLN